MKLSALRVSLIPSILLACAAFAPRASAQGEKFNFGSPLRYNIVFGYTYSERVKTSLYDEGGAMVDSAERMVVYHISERQVLADSASGKIDFQANVDSMEVTYRNFLTGETTTFNTQKPEDIGNVAKVRHREVLGPSVVVNRFVTFNLSPYGDILSHSSEALEDIREQTKGADVDGFTRVRVHEVTGREQLASLYFPWRGVAPVGRTVTMEEPLNGEFTGVLDRLPFHDKVVSRLRNTDKGLMLSYESTFNGAAAPATSITSLDDPLEVKSLRGSVSGELKLDEDGVARSGWSGATGVISGASGGKNYTYAVSHEIYIQQVDMTPFVAN